MFEQERDNERDAQRNKQCVYVLVDKESQLSQLEYANEILLESQKHVEFCSEWLLKVNRR